MIKSVRGFVNDGGMRAATRARPGVPAVDRRAFPRRTRRSLTSRRELYSMRWHPKCDDHGEGVRVRKGFARRGRVRVAAGLLVAALCVGLVASVATVACAGEMADLESRVVEETLPNGMRVIVLPRHQSPDGLALDAVSRRRRPGGRRGQRSRAPARAHDVQGHAHARDARLGGRAPAARADRGDRRRPGRRAPARAPAATRRGSPPSKPAWSGRSGRRARSSSRTRSTRSTPPTVRRISTPAPASTSPPTRSACPPTGCRCGRASSPSGCASR